MADVRRIKSICEWRSEAAAADCDCAAEVMLAMLETLEATAVLGREVMRDRVWARARARMARKASWSVLQAFEAAQATSVRVPLVLLLLRPEAKVVAIAGTMAAWMAVQRV